MNKSFQGPGERVRTISRQTWDQIWKQVVIWVILIFALYPVCWVISAAFDPANTIVGQRLIPKHASVLNFVRLFDHELHPFVSWFFNTFKVALTSSFIGVCLTSLAGYAFSRMRFRGRKTGLFAILLIQIFPQMLALVAIYLIIFWIGHYIPGFGLDTHGGLTLVYLGGAMGVNVWMVKSYFDTIPYSLEESAKIDGATPLQMLVKIILPLARPILVVVFFLQFIANYSEYVLARVLLATNEKLTMAVGLQVFTQDQFAQRWGVFSAAALIGAIPVLLLFWLLQNQLVTGLTRGSIK